LSYGLVGTKRVETYPLKLSSLDPVSGETRPETASLILVNTEAVLEHDRFDVELSQTRRVLVLVVRRSGARGGGSSSSRSFCGSSGGRGRRLHRSIEPDELSSDRSRHNRLRFVLLALLPLFLLPHRVLLPLSLLLGLLPVHADLLRVALDALEPVDKKLIRALALPRRVLPPLSPPRQREQELARLEREGERRLEVDGREGRVDAEEATPDASAGFTAS
jgi:hypothetical protein